MRSATDIHGLDDPVATVRGVPAVARAPTTRWSPAPGVLRPHCEAFVRSLEALGRHEFTSRWEGARRAIRENGVTYNVYGDPQGIDRPWELDMVPLLISPAEWTRLETALIQRTRLLNLILADLYGPQDSCSAPACCRRRSCSRTRPSCGRVTAFRVPQGCLPAPARRRPGALA